MTKFDKSYALQLLLTDEQDLPSSKVLASHLQTGRIENAFFLPQQAVEKSLKAYLCHVHCEFPLLHDIEILATLTIRPSAIAMVRGIRRVNFEPWPKVEEASTLPFSA